MTMRLIKIHGSRNEIFAVPAAPAAWESDAALREFARRVCDRDSWTGGGDGVYFYDARPSRARAWFVNPDGSSAEFCGNGMRGLGRLILDQRGTETEAIDSGGRCYTVRRGRPTPEGVCQVLLELPPVKFAPVPPSPFDGFTAVAVPNPHVVAIVPEYCEPDLIKAGKHADEVFPSGANVSFLLPLAEDGDCPEAFVRTFERGAGLTPSCGSGVVASRAAYSRVTGFDPERRLVIRNAGGVAAASIRVRGDGWFPVLEGNATVIYRAEVDQAGEQAGPTEYATGENAAYAALDERNTARLKSAGVTTARPATVPMAPPVP